MIRTSYLTKNVFENVKVEKPTLTYRVFADGRWYDEVKGLGGVAGRKKQAISALAVKVSKGDIKYRVHLRDGDWLDWVDGYDINDSNNGYAGIKGKVIDAVQVEFSGVGDYKATYRARKQGKINLWHISIIPSTIQSKTVTQVLLALRLTACRLRLHEAV